MPETLQENPEIQENIDLFAEEFRRQVEDNIFDAALSYAKPRRTSNLDTTQSLESIFNFLEELRKKRRLTFKRGNAKTSGSSACYYHWEAPYDAVIFVPSGLENEKQMLREKLLAKCNEAIKAVARRINVRWRDHRRCPMDCSSVSSDPG